jgi:hypothetical protein
MKIKDLLNFSAFQGAEIVDYETHETIIDDEKEIEDIHSIQLNEEVDYLNAEYKYAALHRWLTVYITTEVEMR